MNFEVYNSHTTREPRPLPMPDENACLSCVTTNILYMNHLVDKEWSVHDTDELISRQPGQPLNEGEVNLLLLEKGFTLKCYGSFDSARFIQEGKSYLWEVYSDVWPEPAFSEYWTDQKVQERQQARRAESAKFAQYETSFEDIVEEPSLDTIGTLVNDGYQVIAQVMGPDGSSVHSVLVHKVVSSEDDEGYEVYYPSPYEGDDGLAFLTKSEFAAEWRPDEGVTGVKRSR